MSIDRDDPRLLAYALDELGADEAKEIAAAVEADEELQNIVKEFQDLTKQISAGFAAEVQPELTPANHKAINEEVPQCKRPRRISPFVWLSMGVAAVATICVVVLGGVLMMDASRPSPNEGSVAYSSPISAAKSEDFAEKDWNQYHDASPKPAGDYLAESKPATTVDGTLSYTVGADGKGKKLQEKGGYNYTATELSVTRMELFKLNKNLPADHSRLPGSATPLLTAEATSQVVGSHMAIVENKYISPWAEPLSTFSIDVDTASYSMMRQQLKRNTMPHRDSVRLEEMVNYFSYDYPQPKKGDPFSVSVEAAACPWNLKHRLVKIGLKGREIKVDKRPSSNLVFLLDVSGSMSSANKLGYVKQSMSKLVDQLGESDRVAITVYAGAAGLVLPSTTADNKDKIKESLNKLNSGGSTAGGAGIRLAYKVAKENCIQKGVNRVILCSDGDFNVGISDRAELEKLIEEQAKSGVYLSILGYGMGNYRDGRMEAISNKGNGNYAYIDNMKEAEKVLVKQMSGTLVTIAKDVKIQVNFNKFKVHAYRLLGYENRMLKKEDFHDDTKDAGEIGAGHTVTALYEVVPMGVDDVKLPRVDDDKYSPQPSGDEGDATDELLTVKLRHKKPDAKESTLQEHPVADQNKSYSDASTDFKFAASVAGFGMLLRKSEFAGTANYKTIMELADEGRGTDKHGYRKEFLELVKIAMAMDAKLKEAKANVNASEGKTK